jgi:uncharacterized membrane protein YdjX (TVP38/TMEM64 family)
MFFLFPTNVAKSGLITFIEWAKSTGPIGLVLLIVFHVFAIVICFPGTILFELAEGLIFGVIYGGSMALLAKTLGASLSYLLGRSLLHEWMKKKMSFNHKYREVFNAIKADGWKLAMLLRLSPIPSWAINYGLALSPIPFITVVWTTLIGSIPTIIQNVFVGSFLQSLTDDSAIETNVAFKRVMMIFSIVCSAVVMKLLYKYFSIAKNTPSSGSAIENVFNGLLHEDPAELHSHIP